MKIKSYTAKQLPESKPVAASGSLKRMVSRRINDMKKCKYCGDDGTGLPCSHCMTQSQWESRVAEKIFMKSKVKSPKTRRAKAARLILESWKWEVEAKWKGDIEYEKAEIVSPLKVAMMVARSLRAGCVSVGIVRKSNTVAETASGAAKKTRPPEGQRIRCWGKNDRLIGEGIYHNARAVKNHSRAFVSLDDGFWASWNSVKRWASAETANDRTERQPIKNL